MKAQHHSTHTPEVIAVARLFCGEPVDTELLTEPLRTVMGETQSASEDRIEAFRASATKHGLSNAEELIEMAARTSPNSEPMNDAWEFWTLADAYESRHPVEYIVSGLFALPSLSVVYGAPGTMKSMVLADMCICVASGKEWLPPLPNAPGSPRLTKQAPVMWVDFDNGALRTHERFAALGKARDLLPNETPLSYTSMPTPWLNVSSAESVNNLEKRIKALGVLLCVIDNLGVITGSAEENTSEMANVMAGLRGLSERTGAAIVLIHHQRKMNGAKGRTGDTLRGHSSIEAALDLALLIEREDHSDLLTIRSTKTRGSDVFPFGARFTYEHKEDSNQLAKAKFYVVQIEDSTSDAALEQEITAAVTAKPNMNKGELKKAVQDVLTDVGVNRIGKMIDKLAADKKIISTTGTRGARQYSLAAK